MLRGLPPEDKDWKENVLTIRKANLHQVCVMVKERYARIGMEQRISEFANTPSASVAPDETPITPVSFPATAATAIPPQDVKCYGCGETGVKRSDCIKCAKAEVERLKGLCKENDVWYGKNPPRQRGRDNRQEDTAGAALAAGTNLGLTFVSHKQDTSFPFYAIAIIFSAIAMLCFAMGGASRYSFAGSASSVTSRLVVDTGSDSHILRDRHLFKTYHNNSDNITGISGKMSLMGRGDATITLHNGQDVIIKNANHSSSLPCYGVLSASMLLDQKISEILQPSL